MLEKSGIVGEKIAWDLNVLYGSVFGSLGLTTLVTVGAIFVYFGLSILISQWQSMALMYEIRRQILKDKDFTLKKIADYTDINFIFCTTHLNLGTYLAFSAKDTFGPTYSIKDIDRNLSFAIGLSACFPPVFTPRNVGFTHFRTIPLWQFRKTPDLDDRLTFDPGVGKQKRRIIIKGLSDAWVNDGGNFDNMGVDPMLKKLTPENDKIGVFIFSDGGGSGVFDGGISRLFIFADYFSLIYNEQRRLRVTMIQSFISKYTGIYVGIGEALREEKEILQPTVNFQGIPGFPSENIYNQSLVQQIAGIKTDFARFTDSEIQSLICHGYTMTTYKLRKRFNIRNVDGSPCTPVPMGFDECYGNSKLKLSRWQ
ncbi:hypothetical protein GCM10008938_33140 [Deinococcus roseus]|uniref:PNPLA domain-containing protein n=2 Tax=Deinococcus roseus TaxID=392414 RepID=A0ABQ2D7D3_9DEIO|nr:hypothetical protein GCM10008938_33140 [Deinococcus roseus]